ncbi:carotenoid-cleaving dioxygenase, mitochondrial-like isoform X2 [Lampetra fluviatilis]
MEPTMISEQRDGGEPQTRHLQKAEDADLLPLYPLLRSVEEVEGPVEATVTGRIPAWLSGSLLRNGPGRFEVGPDCYNHWFDGMALMHRFRVHDGRVSYSSRFLRSDSYLLNEARQRIVVSEFGTVAFPDPCKTLFDRFFACFRVPEMSDNNLVSIVEYQQDFYAMSETPALRRIDPVTLQTKEKVNWSDLVAVSMATAHPHSDPDGTSYNLGNSFGKGGPSYNIIRIPASKSGRQADGRPALMEGATIVASIPASSRLKPSYYHSFGMTENYIVFLEMPLCMDMVRLMSLPFRHKATVEQAMVYEPRRGTRIHVVNKHTGEPVPVEFRTRPLVCLHHVNAYEEEEEETEEPGEGRHRVARRLVVDLCVQEGSGAYSAYHLVNMRQTGAALRKIYQNGPRYGLQRLLLPLPEAASTPAGTPKKTKSKVWVEPEALLSDEELSRTGGFELPAVNYARHNGRRYRFAYGCGFRHLVGELLLKVDVVARAIAAEWRLPGYFPSEPVFVESPDAEHEDSGLLLSVVVSPLPDLPAFLLILDAATFAEVARAEVRVAIPYGFHGKYAPGI